jgi:beta-glucosidase
LLRRTLGFDGIVCTDWGLLTDFNFFGDVVPARAWGVENLSRDERMMKALDAGVDQFGGETCTEALVSLVRSHQVDVSRIDASARRLLREKFILGLFDDPLVDEFHAADVVGRADFRQLGVAAQRRSVTVITNTFTVHTTLPLANDRVVYAEGIDRGVLATYATVTNDIACADVAIVRVTSPYEPRDHGFERLFHAGSLEFTDAELERLLVVCRSVPTVIDIPLDRPAVLGHLATAAAAVVATYGCCDTALLDVLFGRAQPEGSLPFDLPRSMAAVTASREDVSFDTADPLFVFGHGLRS